MPDRTSVSILLRTGYFCGGPLAIIVAALLLASTAPTDVAASKPHLASMRGGTIRRMGGGTARAWVRLDDGGNPSSLGVTFPERSLEGLSEPTALRSGELPALKFDFPTDITGLPFKQLVINWHAQAPSETGAPDQAHFDFHFYTTSEDNRRRTPAANDPPISITMSRLETKLAFTEPLAQPERYPGPGYYPTAYSVTYDAHKHEYTVALESLTRR